VIERTEKVKMSKKVRKLIRLKMYEWRKLAGKMSEVSKNMKMMKLMVELEVIEKQVKLNETVFVIGIPGMALEVELKITRQVHQDECLTYAALK